MDRLEADQLPAVAAFARVAESGSFTKAAAHLGVSPSALSQTVRGLEARLGIRLLNRTTRRVGVTEAGAFFLASIRPALEQFAHALGALEDLRGQPAGVLRISVASVALKTLIAPLLAEFCATYPQIRLDLVSDDRLVDLVGENFDAGIRLGERLAKDMIAVRVGPSQRQLVVGSPGYFARHGRPEMPEDLYRHGCLRLRFSSGTVYRWELARDGQELELDVDGPLICNDNSTLIEAARQGVGLALVMENLVSSELKSGLLEPVLENWCPSFPGFYLYYPSRAQMPLKLRALIDFVSARTKA